jgi:hypothetical protein
VNRAFSRQVLFLERKVEEMRPLVAQKLEERAGSTGGKLEDVGWKLSQRDTSGSVTLEYITFC